MTTRWDNKKQIFQDYEVARLVDKFWNSAVQPRSFLRVPRPNSQQDFEAVDKLEGAYLITVF